MLTCYFDASYDSPISITVVSGWVASSAAWEQFDADWRILLAQYDIPYFHMREFAHSVGPFAGWKGEEIKRANFLRKAVDIIRACALRGFACLVEQAPLDQDQFAILPFGMGWHPVRTRRQGLRRPRQYLASKGATRTRCGLHFRGRRR